MECQVEKKHFRHLFLYGFNQGSKAAEADQNICAVYGEDSSTERTAKKWFARFRKGNSAMSDTFSDRRPFLGTDSKETSISRFLGNLPCCLGSESQCARHNILYINTI
jgi:hypothetical protein